jgi:hypothetical protein
MYVGTGKRANGLGRLARRAHRLSGLRGLRGSWVNGRYVSGAQLDGLLSARLGQMDYDDGVTVPTYNSPYDTSTPAGQANWASVLSPNQSPSSGGGLTTAEAQLISQGITTGGQLASKALTPVPTVTYNPATGMYSATGGAALPAGLGLSSSLSSLFSSPLLLLGILGIGAVVLLKR